MSKPDFWWHIHHNILMEGATEPIENRIRFITTQKPSSEVQTRIRLLNPVQGRLPWRLVRAFKALTKLTNVYHEACHAYDEAWAARDAADSLEKENKAYGKAANALNKASGAYTNARKKSREKIEALHAKECPDCPWDGHTIFPREVRV